MKAKSAFNNKLFALNVVISIPVPDNTAKADIQTTQGTQLYCLQLLRLLAVQARISSPDLVMFAVTHSIVHALKTGVQILLFLWKTSFGYRVWAVAVCGLVKLQGLHLSSA